jgi:hypothetical protein
MFNHWQYLGMKMRRDLNSLGFNFWCLFNRLPTQYILATHTYWQQTSYWQHILICTYWQHLIIINTYVFATHTYWQHLIIINTYLFWQYIHIGNIYLLAIHTYWQCIPIGNTYLLVTIPICNTYLLTTHTFSISIFISHTTDHDVSWP